MLSRRGRALKLAELQRVMRDALLAAHDDAPAISAAARLINDSPGLSAEAHLQIYRRAVTGTLTRALGEIHPVCRRLTGTEFFDAMARAFIRTTASQSPDLANYGADFTAFIAAFEAAAALPYLSDVARLEWHWHRAFHAATSPALDTAALAAVSAGKQPQVRFLLPPSAALLASPWPVHRIWQVNQPDYRGDDRVNLDEGAARLIVWRHGRQMRIDSLDEREWWLLDQFGAGLTLGELGAPPDLAMLLPRCVARGWLASFTLHAA